MPSLLFAALVLIPLGPAQPAFGSTKSSVQACTGANVIGAFAYSNLYAGGALITIAVVNVGTFTCRLGGYPKLLGIRDGHEYALAKVSHGTQDVSLEPAILTPRMSGALILDTSLGCNANVYPYPVSDQYTGGNSASPPQRARESCWRATVRTLWAWGKSTRLGKGLRLQLTRKQRGTNAATGSCWRPDAIVMEPGAGDRRRHN